MFLKYAIKKLTKNPLLLCSMVAILFVCNSTNDVFDLIRNKINQNFSILSIKNKIHDILELKLNKLGPCNSSIVRLNYLLSQLCNDSQLAGSAELRECRNCFSTATSNPLTQTLITNLLPCAMTYLANTRFEDCIASLQDSLQSGVQINPNTLCPTGYCSFVQCVRKININYLISECYKDSILTNDLDTDQGIIDHYIATTACILTMTRCNKINPITGMPNSPFLSTTQYIYGKPYTQNVELYNALHITASEDLRILTFPKTSAATTFFCANQTNIDQVGYGTVNC